MEENRRREGEDDPTRKRKSPRFKDSREKSQRPGENTPIPKEEWIQRSKKANKKKIKRRMDLVRQRKVQANKRVKFRLINFNQILNRQ